MSKMVKIIHPVAGALSAYKKAIDTGNDSYGAQGEAEKYLKAPSRDINVLWPVP